MGLWGGLSSVANGGRFEHGFLSAGASTAMTPYSARVPGGYLGQISAAAVVGGTVSELGGGRFANGATTAAFLQSTAVAADYYRRTTGFAADPTPGDKYYEANGKCCEYKPGVGGRTPGPVYDVIGFNEQLTGNFRADFGKQGGALAKYFLRWVPGVPATSHLHDTWLNPLTANGMAISPLRNYGTMLPAYAISSAAIVGNATQGWQNNPMVWHTITQRYNDRD